MDFHSILFHLAQIPFIGSFFFQMSPLAHGDHVAQRGAVWGHTKPAFSLMDAGAELQWVNGIKSASTLSEWNQTKDLCPAPS